MRKFLFLAAISIFSFQSAQAAFYPLDQSIMEIRDIISSPDFKRFIPQRESILDIRRMQNGYMITTNHYQLFVEVRYRPLLRQQQSGEQQEIKQDYTLFFNQAKQVSE